MKLKISYDRYQNNWYVGELYHSFYLHLKSIFGVDIEFESLKSLSEKFPKIDDSCVSIFNIFNLIITNKETNKTFIHSLSDYAPAMMDDCSGILNFDISAFSCTSNLNKIIIDNYSKKYKILPSFYILENYNDVDLIESLRKKNDRKINSCYFNGLCYGHRGRYLEILSRSESFVFKNKNNENDFKNKKEYYEELNRFKFGLSLNGAAKICYRDLEYFGLGILCLRENLDVITRTPLLPNIHYINFIDDEINSILYDYNKSHILKEKLENKLMSIIDKDYSDVLNNSRKWYENNCTPQNQIKILYSFLEECSII